MVVVKYWGAFVTVAGIILIALTSKYRAARHDTDGLTTPVTLDPIVPARPKLVFVTAWIDLGPDHMEKTPAVRLQHFKRLAASGIPLFVFVSPSNVAAMEDVQTEFPNILGLRSIEMEDLLTVQTIRSISDLQLPASLTNSKDTQGFLELMLAKIDFVYQALPYTDASHLAWIDFNIAHVFDNSLNALVVLQDLQQRDLAPSLLAFPVIWGPQTGISMDELTQRVNWRFAGGFFLGDRRSLKHWYHLCSDTLRLFLAQTHTLVWEVNFWAWLENMYPQSFCPSVYTSDHDNSLVAVPDEFDRLSVGEGHE